MEIPDDRYYGIQTSRMVKVSGCAHLPVIFYPGMHRALFRIKKACALAGEFDKEFQLDMWQAGGYTCVNMNVNEVIPAMPPTKSSRVARSGRRAPEHPCEQGPVDERHHSVRHAPCRIV